MPGNREGSLPGEHLHEGLRLLSGETHTKVGLNTPYHLSTNSVSSLAPWIYSCVFVNKRKVGKSAERDMWPRSALQLCSLTDLWETVEGTGKHPRFYMTRWHCLLATMVLTESWSSTYRVLETQSWALGEGSPDPEQTPQHMRFPLYRNYTEQSLSFFNEKHWF